MHIPPPLSLYIHLPWCLKKCPYCDFNSYEAPEQRDEKRYIEALITDLEQELPLIWGRRIDTIFIGGGTPSLFTPESLQALFDGLRSRLPLRPSMEITLEANPGTFEQARFQAFREIGISRLSIGIQSFNTQQLKALGRVHDAEEALAAVDIARNAGFDNVNLDLMFALPEQSLQQAQQDLATALSFEPEHLSYYQLTLEPNTLFHRYPPVVPDDDTAWQIQQQGQQLLAAQGYEQYEVSAYAKVGQRCRHNLNYWEFADYLGIGAGAHGKISLPGENRIVRRQKHRHPERYMDKALAGEAVSEERELSQEDLRFEFMLNALRLRQGVEKTLFSENTGLGWESIQETVLQAQNDGLLMNSDERIQTTALGQQYLNDLVGRFLPDQEN